MAAPNSSGTLSTGSHSLEQISPSVSREWLFDKRIVVYTVMDAHRESIDVWAGTCTADIASWPGDRPVLIMHDLSARGIALTPYARERSQPMMDMRPEAKGRVAIVLQPGIAASLIQLFLRPERKAPRVRRAFTSREKAIEWLLSE